MRRILLQPFVSIMWNSRLPWIVKVYGRRNADRLPPPFPEQTSRNREMPCRPSRAQMGAQGTGLSHHTLFCTFSFYSKPHSHLFLKMCCNIQSLAAPTKEPGSSAHSDLHTDFFTHQKTPWLTETPLLEPFLWLQNPGAGDGAHLVPKAKHWGQSTAACASLPNHHNGCGRRHW